MINTAIFLTIMFIFVRLSSFFIVFNVIFPTGTPRAMKLFIPMVLAFTISGSVSNIDITLLNSNYHLIMYLICEVLTGSLLGLVTKMIFEILKFAGSWIDLHIGFSMLSLADATASATTTATGKFLEYFSLALFFVTDAHHLLIKALIESFSIVSIGSSMISKASMWNSMQVIIEYFFIGVKIALPIVLIIIMTDLCMGLISRVVPQINVMILGMPVKMIVGLLMLILSIELIAKVFISTLSYLPSIIRKILSVAPVALIFMSDDKTEEATPKKKADARKKGQIARSKDVGIALTTIATLMVIIAFSEKVINNFRDIIIHYLSNLSSIELTESTLKAIAQNAFINFLSTIILVVIPIMIAGIVASIMQSGFLFTGEGLKPSFKKLNPLNGFKNMFSKKSAFDLLKNLIVVSIVTFIGYSYMRDNYRDILQISSLYEGSLGGEIKNIVVGLFTKIVILLIILAAADYFIQFRFHKKDLMMSKQEIKDEFKQAEGDQQVKAKIKQKQRAMSRQRMMNAVGDATVIVTNPTHIAVAIKYEEGENNAPKLVAKGADHLAIKIKEKAKEHNVPIIENKPLARMIYKEVELDREIPQQMYQAVAEILVVIYKMKDKKKTNR